MRKAENMMTLFQFIATSEQELSPVETTTTSIVSLIILVLSIIAFWKIFTKAGQPGWKSLIPIYGLYTLVKIVDGNGWKFLLFCIPFVNIVYYIIFNLRMAKAYGKGTGFGIGLIFLDALFALILGFGSASYVGPKGQAQA